jgi:CBS domain-containing protein
MKSCLSLHRVSDLWVNSLESPVVLTSNQNIVEAARILSASQISAAPVIGAESKEIEFVFDFRDLCSLIHKKSGGFRDQMEYQDILPRDMTIQQAKRSEGSFPKVSLEDDLNKAAEWFSKGIHKLCVFKENQFVGMISQSDLVQFMHDKLGNECRKTLDQTLTQLNIAKKKTIAINCQKKVFEAVQLMLSEHVSSVGLLDCDEDEVDAHPPNAPLMGIISMTDIKEIFHHRSFHQFDLKLADYISDRVQSSSKTRFPVFSVRPVTSLEQVIQKLSATRSHRIYVTEHMSSVGVISLTDIIKVLTLE